MPDKPKYQCQGTCWGKCSKGGVTHFDAKGYTYCAKHAREREQSGVCNPIRRMPLAPPEGKEVIRA